MLEAHAKKILHCPGVLVRLCSTPSSNILVQPCSTSLFEILVRQLCSYSTFPLRAVFFRPCSILVRTSLFDLVRCLFDVLVRSLLGAFQKWAFRCAVSLFELCSTSCRDAEVPCWGLARIFLDLVFFDEIHMCIYIYIYVCSIGWSSRIRQQFLHGGAGVKLLVHGGVIPVASRDGVVAGWILYYSTFYIILYYTIPYYTILYYIYIYIYIY
jgi:hypothetical protein